MCASDRSGTTLNWRIREESRDFHPIFPSARQTKLGITWVRRCQIMQDLVTRSSVTMCRNLAMQLFKLFWSVSEIFDDIDHQVWAWQHLYQEIVSDHIECCPILSSRFHRKKGLYESFDSWNGEPLLTIRHVELSIRKVHLIRGT